MPDSLEIHVNRKRPNVLEVPEMFVADDAFDIEVVNAGKPVHVHLNLDDDLDEVMELRTGNHFVPREDTFRLPVRLRDGKRPVRGKVHVSTGYGSESRFIEVRVVEPQREDSVIVDDTLATPSGRPQKPALSAHLVSDAWAIALVLLAIVALFAGAAIVAALTSPVIGALVVIAALLIAVGVYLFL